MAFSASGDASGNFLTQASKLLSPQYEGDGNPLRTEYVIYIVDDLLIGLPGFG